MVDARLAETLMEEFAERTGVQGTRPPRRYLWTDAFALCNFLALRRRTGDQRYLSLAQTLLDQVHHVLGRHRADDPRRGWISGLSEAEGERHPTIGGLRIGKRLLERPEGARFDERQEWDRDGQYFHYLTKWIRALQCMSNELGDPECNRWAVELAESAHKGFARDVFPGGPKRIVWKMSIDLSRPLVPSFGQHDPLDGLITLLELQPKQDARKGGDRRLANEIDELSKMCAAGRWVSEDPLSAGGLLECGYRLGRLVFENDVPLRGLLERALVDAETSLRLIDRERFSHGPAGHRLAFRELGLAIGIETIRHLQRLVASDDLLRKVCRRLSPHESLGEQIRAYWSGNKPRQNRTWEEHVDINSVMLATCIVPDRYLGI
jgi:hypothetical protein